MKVFTKKRAAALVAGLGAVGLISGFTYAGTSALYSSDAATQNNQITSGTVTIGVDSGKSTELNISNYMPGDKATSRYRLVYTGSSEAFVGVDFTVTSTAHNPCTSDTITANQTGISPDELDCSGVGELPLMDGKAGSADLYVMPAALNTAHQIIDNSAIQSGTVCSTDGSNIVTCSYEATDVLLPYRYSLKGDATYGLQWPGGDQATTVDGVYVNTSLDKTAGNGNQGSTTTITLQAHAVQWKNNVATGSGCDPATTFPPNITSPNAPCPVSWS